MPPSPDIDRLYESFCSKLSGELQKVARTLAFRLRLTPAPDIPWSAVFNHPVTLSAPALFAEAMRAVDPALLEHAITAHLLAVIEAFGTDRIADGQTPDDFALHQVLARMRRARDEALLAVGGAAAVAHAAEADRTTVRSIEEERRLLITGDAVDLRTYEAISAGKQAVGIPASVALARACGAGSGKVEVVRSTLMGIWLGLQLQDDVVDWEDDVRRGGAWAVALALDWTRLAKDVAPPDDLRRFVLSSGVLADMLGLAVGHFQTARSGAEWLGATDLAAWLGVREREALGYYESEQANPGYLVRLRKLAPWAAEVIG